MLHFGSLQEWSWAGLVLIERWSVHVCCTEGSFSWMVDLPVPAQQSACTSRCIPCACCHHAWEGVTVRTSASCSVHCSVNCKRGIFHALAALRVSSAAATHVEPVYLSEIAHAREGPGLQHKNVVRHQLAHSVAIPCPQHNLSHSKRLQTGPLSSTAPVVPHQPAQKVTTYCMLLVI